MPIVRLWRMLFGALVRAYRRRDPTPRMTEAEALALLVVRHPCGCVEHWEASPPYQMTCIPHIGFPAGPMPARFLEAREALRDFTLQNRRAM